MTFSYPWPGNYPIYQNYLIDNNLQLQLEVEQLKTENMTLKNTIQHQKSQLQQQASTEKKMISDIVAIKNDINTMNFFLKENIDKKIDEIKNEQQMGFQLVKEIWKMNICSAFHNFKRLFDEEKTTQTDFENDNIIVQSSIFSDDQKQSIDQMDFESEGEVFEGVYHDTKMETQFSEMSNDCSQKSNSSCSQPAVNSAQNEDENSGNKKRERLMITMYTCEDCDRKYVSKEKLDMHKKRAHKTKQCRNFSQHQKHQCKKPLEISPNS